MTDLNDFKTSDLQQWEKQVMSDLGLEHIDSFNSLPLAKDIDQPPYVDATSVKAGDLIRSYRNCQMHHGEDWQGARYWLNMESIEGSNDYEVNQLALNALMGGADGVIATINEQSDWKQLLANISLMDCSLGVKGTAKAFMGLKDYLTQHQLSMRGFALLTDLDHQIDLQSQQLSAAVLGSPDLRLLTLKEEMTSVGSLKELAILLSHSVAVINRLLDSRITLENIAPSFQLTLEMSDAYLWEVCRLRCLRILFHQVIQHYGIASFKPKNLSIHALTKAPVAKDNMSLIRNTGQAMAGVLGGCDILTVVPDLTNTRLDVSNARRVARNVSHILKQECHLHLTADPVAGSYYLEDLTNRMLKEVWSKFQSIENSGGYFAKSSMDI